LSYTVQKLPVLAYFQSSKTMNFSTLIAPVDDQGRAASFSATCTAHDSVVPLSPFLLSLSKLKAGGGKPIKVGMKTVKTHSALMSEFVSTSDFMDLTGDYSEPFCNIISML
jgi:uncharacterized protein YjfI (DUF2170 family)